ncbi:MAG: hypothetical protein QG670_839 [Thermoproteota archaeon]|nr:hypothetical protein [Thermoproteota archaeon]
MKMYYSLWSFTENRFSEPIFYDYSFPVNFPNVVFSAKSFMDAKKKIRAVNSKIGRMDRFDSLFPKIMKRILVQSTLNSGLL